ncbi:MAG TPA: 7-cyano-7-deazaguanine synthase QueC [Vicinamibacteria bacterium]|jgi:7-cyano-7-deazaguanine synthase|nr:7-cyano-7-deazaguanine synthase QueC [Vicinamibacteria bacterium]
MARDLAVVCVSGGMDSCVTAALAAREHRLAFLHADYGQRTEAKERGCFEALADHFGAERRLVVDFPALRAIGGSSLTDASIAVREGAPVEGVIPTSYVPFRNAHLLAAAVSWGELLGARAVFVGAVWEDSSGYPDCRPEFYRAYQEAVRLGTRPDTDIRIVTPVIGMSKAEIVRQGTALGAPFEKTWSCYQDGQSACGVCESCRLRMRGFAEAGVTDPIPYRALLESSGS